MNKHIFRGKKLLIGFIPAILLSGALMPQMINADFEASALNKTKVAKTVKMWVTGYESKPEQTDNSPRIAASGKEVFNGMVAVNGLPFGTKIRIREVFGDRELEVWDRMHSRKRGVVDIWMENGAKEFGAKLTNIEILEN